MAFDTYTQLRQAEDVQDDIYIVSPVDNPVCSMSRSIRATGKLHEWTEDSLRAAGSNKALEGADFAGDNSTPVVEKSNNCQIMVEGAEITGTLESVDKYGRDSEMVYQLERSYGALANDEELAVMGAPGGTRQTGSAGAVGTAREMTSLHNQWAAGVKVDAALYTTVAQLETGVLSAHEKAYTLGGNPSYMTTSPANAQYISAFAYASGRQRDIRNETQLVNVIELYVSHYGELDIILDRNTDSCFMGIDFNYTATPVLRPTTDFPIARTGDSEKRQVIRESTFALLNSESGFIVDNIPGSLT